MKYLKLHQAQKFLPVTFFSRRIFIQIWLILHSLALLVSKKIWDGKKAGKLQVVIILQLAKVV